ncbi:MAG: prolyl oligopeptidase family serine peptidase [Actinomycetia bacterium]|nr:prolyl oligopeptidase family serine peptidase [Actinomycetes bacterium]
MAETSPKIAAYGSWESPIDAERIASGSIRLSEVHLEGEWVYWLELRPAEGGRCVVVRSDIAGNARDVTPEGFSARSRVHEYGGGSYLPCGDEVIFVNFTDQRLYRCDGRGSVMAVTPDDGDVRYANFVRDQSRQRIIAVREDHRPKREAENSIVTVSLESGKVDVLVKGNDFYSSPRVSPDGSQLAWLTWNHPDMPWDAAELWAAPLASDGSLGEAGYVAGGPDESVLQPQWSPDAGEPELYFVSDRSDWWNIFRISRRDGQLQAMTQLEAEFGTPPWVFGTSCYAFASPGRIICTYVQNGTWRLASLDCETKKLETIETPYNTVGYLRAAGPRAAFIGGSATAPTAVVVMDLDSGKTRQLQQTNQLQIGDGYISAPQAVEFPTSDGLSAHGLFYPPANKDYSISPGSELEFKKPPLMVKVHGGPTSSASASLQLGIQYFTSRGIAVLDVNYGGSTGYGRKYRQRLAGLWGVVDVDDCCGGAEYLARRGLVDPKRMAITGGSAGGYTTLSALVFRDVFSAGASHYGVSDCQALAEETHKFESCYLDHLIGPYPREKHLYIERSPIHHVDGLSAPVIFFQGDEDKIVPPNQAQMMADALRRKRLPVAYVLFTGEQHGFRQAQNIRRALEGQLYFFSRIFGFEPADEIEPVKIDNLPVP